ncbi:uncharacterized protein BDCG_16191 [Blastomyces dermatitidis ER-3]|uniref:Uncharacterized protein n=1 Tax=Ajellomyces dermatitidis (strain ER-3 / ATCC MYA-2586) TaxID=559297 RepID=A0ABX2VQL3_AJEDR|nr:uncharacterized protein BDCG_16191 [Blastomyces dermatitidis ER-3]OAS99543.1 hypothetical protein BDCG_16191 [Blastomyces dermatitidis ER-3]
MSDHYQASYRHLYNFSDHFLSADEAGVLLSITASSSLSALPLHLIFRPVINSLPFSDQSLTSSSAVPLFTCLLQSHRPMIIFFLSAQSLTRHMQICLGSLSMVLTPQCISTISLSMRDESPGTCKIQVIKAMQMS